MSFQNLATWDRTVRVALGAIMLIAGWAAWVPGVWDVALKIFGWVPLVTGLIGWCPVYAMLRFSTLKRRAAPRDS